MPNRKTFDEREKYDHSAHSTRGAEKGDLAPTPDASPRRDAPPEQPLDEVAHRRSRRTGRGSTGD
jgi:hypothetical protein